MTSDILIAGAGPIAREYSRILSALGHSAWAIGRSQTGCDEFYAETGLRAVAGGVEVAIAQAASIPDRAIVAVSEAQLGHVTRSLIAAGVKEILVEKPGGLNGDDIRSVATEAAAADAKVYVGYNRRFHASTLAARERIAADGGITALHFEFTEWSHRIEPIQKEYGVKEAWFIQNSSHVVDLAFFLGGWPREISAFTAGSLSWHPYARYSGAGVTDQGALFSYFADWEAPGRWSVEAITRANRYIFRPLEQLRVQERGSVAVNPAEIDDKLDQDFKPGFYRQTAAFLGDKADLSTIDEQTAHLSVYASMHPGV